MLCPKCQFETFPDSVDCARCGVVFAKLRQHEESEDVPIARPAYEEAEEVVSDGRVGPRELRILGFGLGSAILIYAFPLTRYVFSVLVTLFHEFGHAVAGWLLGYPSLPAFDFVYGGGLTTHGEFHLSIAIAVGAGLGYLAFLFRQNRKAAALIGIVFLVWLFFVTKEWRRELVFASAGHLSEFILAGILFYQALAGVGWRNPDLERPLGAFVAFFVQIHSMLFAWRLFHDAEFLRWYGEGKGGALMNDLEVVALDLHIYAGPNPGIEGMAKALFVFSFIPFAIAMIWYLKRSQWHRLLHALKTVDA